MEKKRVEVVLDPIQSRFLVDLWYFNDDKLVVEFEVREQIWCDPPPFLYEEEDGLGNPVEDPDLAFISISGAVRWDGCSNIDFHTDEVLQHFCDRTEIVRLGELLGRIYDLAAEMMPEHAENLR